MRFPLSIFSLLIFFALTSSAFAQKPWTMLIFLNGKNDLDVNTKLNLLQMEKIGSTDKINIVVQWASLSANKTVRLLVKKSTQAGEVTSPVVEDVGDVDMGNSQTLVDFLEWGARTYPADHYFVDIWDHGSGWHLMNADPLQPISSHVTNISRDERTGNSITTPQLGAALQEFASQIGHKIDLYASDACLMGMAEVADQMADSVMYFGGSEEVEYASGWPYDLFLRHWNALPSPTAEQVGKLLTHDFVSSYEKGGENYGGDVNPLPAVFSLLDLSKMKSFDQAVANWSSEIQRSNEADQAKLIQAYNQTLRFSEPDSGDFMDFLNQARSLQGLSSETYTAAKVAMNHLVVAAEATANYPRSHGLAIWMPNTQRLYNRYSFEYQEIDFENQTHWSSVIQSLLHSN